MATAFELMTGTHDTLSASTAEPSLFDSVSDMVTKGIPSAAIAAGVELANIAPTIGNLVTPGDPYELFNTREALAAYDTDLAKYYDDHKLGVDTVGFIASSLVPGLGGVKALKVGQVMAREAIATGHVGGFAASALGVMTPNRQKHLAEAISSFGKSGNVFKLTEANTVKALGAGVWQNALEGAAFTAVVNATMYNSPILDERSTSDLMWDVAVGGAFGGVLGGAVQAAQTVSGIKRGISAAEASLSPWMVTDSPVPGETAANKIVYRLQQINAMPEVPPDFNLAERAMRTKQQSTNALFTEIRGHIGEITNGDKQLGDRLFDFVKANPNVDDNLKNFLETSSITRVNVTSKAEKSRNAVLREMEKSGTLGLEITPAQRQELSKYNVSFVNLHDPKLSVSDTRPRIMSLPDKMEPGETITLLPNGKGIKAGKKTYVHENNPYRPFNPLSATLEQTQSRQYWAEMSAKWDDTMDIMVHENDIALLQKAQRDGLSKIKVIPESGVIADAYVLNSLDEIVEFTVGKQKSIAARLAAAETIPQTVDDLLGKLKHYLGINFSSVDNLPGVNAFWGKISGSVFGKAVTGDAIGLNIDNLKRPLMDIVRTLKHEEGHAMFQSLLDSTGVTRQNLTTAMPLLASEIEAISKLARPKLWKSTAAQDIAYRTDPHEMFADAFSYLSKNAAQLKKYPEFEKFAGHLVRPIPQEILDAVSKRATKPTAEEIAHLVNAHPDALTGTVSDPTRKVWNLRDNVRETLGGVDDPWHRPTYAKIITEKSLLKDKDGMYLEGMTILKQKEQIYKEGANRVATHAVGEELPSADGLRGAPIGVTTGASFVTAEGGNYGTWSSFFSYVGQRTDALQKKFREITSTTFTPLLQKLAMNRDEAIELSVLNEKMRGLPNNYFLDETGTKLVYGKIPKMDDFDSEEAFTAAMEKYYSKLEELSNQNIPAEIPINSQTVRDLIVAHIDRNNYRRGHLQKMHSHNGYPDRFEEGVFYPIPRNPRDTPHFAFVIDGTVNGRGHSKMIYAKDGETLEKMRNEILSDPVLAERGIRVLTKTESEEYYKSIGQFEFERTLSDNYINSALARSGKSESFLPVTDPNRIVTDFLEWHHARDNNFVRSAVELRYAPEFETLRSMAEPAVQAAKSRTGYISPMSYAQSAVRNPASDLIKMALNVTKMDEYPLWSQMNKFLDGAFSKVVAETSDLFRKAQTSDDLAAVNDALKKAGYKDVINSEALLAASNSKVPRGTLSALVNKANSLHSLLAIRTDMWNAVVNAVGTATLLGPELRSVLKAVQTGNTEIAGELAKMSTLKVPGTGEAVLSPSKLIGGAIKSFFNDPAAREWHKRNGFVTTASEQFDQMQDHISLALSSGNHQQMELAFQKAKKLAEGAEKWSGNKIAEEFSRFIPAEIMRQVTDKAIKAGVMDEKTALSYINTFVNRVQGNHLASQRPVVFQGPIGQAIGLYNTYMFNMLQQTFRYIGEGQGKSVLLMMGLQGGLFGMNGLPAFNAINTHIIGEAGGNTEHKTMYDAIYSFGGKEAGDWLLYGGLANGLSIFHPDLKSNIYSRGDVNPRNLTLVPVDPTKIPIYSATERLFTQLSEGYKKVSMGADLWSTFLRGVEQNGISRPLAGMAQLLEAAGREDKKVIPMNQNGNMLMAHDLWSLSSLMRLTGAKPLDEAIVNDQMFRVNSWRANDAAKRKALAEGVKQSIVGGEEPDEAQMERFAESYARIGGNQAEFVKTYAGWYKDATVSQAAQLAAKVGSPYQSTLQILMNRGE